jgi:hypothetical protein
MATNLPPSAPQKNWKALTHDEIVEEIHAFRAKQYERFGGDAEAIFRHYQEQQKKNPGKKAPLKVLPRRVPA